GAAAGARRPPRHDRRLTRGIELKEIAMRPDVRRVVRDVDRHIAEDREAALPRGLTEILPLTGEDELYETMEGDLAAQRARGLGERLGRAIAQRRRPVRPADVVVG